MEWTDWPQHLLQVLLNLPAEALRYAVVFATFEKLCVFLQCKYIFI